MINNVDKAKHINWGSAPEWLAAIGTILAVFAAIWIATREASSNRRREHIKQAESIAAWNSRSGGTIKVIISNGSKLPIYDVVISYGAAYGAGLPYFKGNDDQAFILRVPPGKWSVAEPRNPGGGMHVQPGISISFRDSTGAYWRRDATGKLIETKQHPFKELDIHEPISIWRALTSLT